MAYVRDGNQLAQQEYYNDLSNLKSRGLVFNEFYPGGFGSYQYIDMEDVIDNFMATYVGEGKLLEKTLRGDASFHGHRALQELSYDTLRSHKSQEIEIPPSLSMVLPHDYVNYVKLSWSGASGIEHVIYPATKTSNPTAIQQNDNSDYRITATATVTQGSATIVLNEKRTDIRRGMRVVSDGSIINNVCTVHEIDYGTSTTTIQLANQNGLTSPCQCYWGTGAATNSQATFHFYNNNKDLVEQEETPILIENASWEDGAVNEVVITADSADDISSVVPGMRASSDHLPINSIVKSVHASTVVLFTDSGTIVGGQTNEDVVFYTTNRLSDTWDKYKSTTPSENTNDDYEDDIYWPNTGQRYGLEPSHAQVNGSFYIDYKNGKIHFSSNLSGKTVILKYISDGIDTSTLNGMLVPKMAEEAIYKWMAYGCASARIDVPEYVIRRLKKERFAEIRKAKLRLSNIKLEEISQILRGKSKQIKH
tara:strand:+ start:612 stop:2048 length:1437 start_codon:yes stop_codon:yes gene_type:complete